jgi:uncharacterized membrane protein
VLPAVQRLLREQPTHLPAGLVGVVGFAVASALLTATEVLFPAGTAGLSGLVSGAGVASLARTQAHSARQATARSSAVFIVLVCCAAAMLDGAPMLEQRQKRTALTIPLP